MPELLEVDKRTCAICGSDSFVDAHHFDCREGKISPETIMLCRRCHRTYHDRGIEWFDDDKLDKAIEIENKHREILNLDRLNEGRKPLSYQQPLRREDILRSNYWTKIHGVRKR